METQEFKVTYWILPEKKTMMKQFAPDRVELLAVLGRDLQKQFDHRHTLVIYPTIDRLDEALLKFKPSNAASWEELFNEYLQVNKVKTDEQSVKRQEHFNQTGLVP